MSVLGLVHVTFIKKNIKNDGVNRLIHVRILTDLLLTPYSVHMFNYKTYSYPTHLKHLRVIELCEDLLLSSDKGVQIPPEKESQAATA